MKAKRLFVDNSRGTTLMESITALAIASIAVVSLLSGFQHINRQVGSNVQKSSQTGSVESVMLRIKALIESDYAWQHIVNANSNMQCADVSTPCAVVFASGVPQGFLIKDPLDVTIFDPAGTPNAFNLRGEPCGFDASNPETCPIMLSATFFPTCPTGPPCSTSPLRIKLKVSLHDSMKSHFNVSDRNFEIIKYPPRFEDIYFSLSFTAASTIAGGDCGAGWTRRPINSSPDRDPDGFFVNIDSGTNEFTLRAGTYVCSLRVLGYGYGVMKSRLIALGGSTFDLHGIGGVTQVASIIDGNVETTHPSTYEQVLTSYFLDRKFTIASDTGFAIEQECSGLQSTNVNWKMGRPGTAGESEFLNFTCKKKKYD